MTHLQSQTHLRSRRAQVLERRGTGLSLQSQFHSEAFRTRYPEIIWEIRGYGISLDETQINANSQNLQEFGEYSKELENHTVEKSRDRDCSCLRRHASPRALSGHGRR